MEKYEYQTLYNLEETFWWFRGLREIILDQIRKFAPKKVSRVLDVGCGTGRNLLMYSKEISEQSFGLDFSLDAAEFWKKRQQNKNIIASANAIPFLSDSFNLVTCIDLLECDEADENLALGEIWRVLAKSGIIIFIVPACQWLYSKEHDTAVHASRRYDKLKFRTLLEKHGFQILRISYLYLSFFPLIALYRLFERIKPRSKIESPRSNIKVLPSFLNSFFSFLVHIEAMVFRKFDFPWGSSILAVARK